ncbi:isochorismatase family protein [Streptomyces tailanensis]|uniref:isochorismatase family protein n=1 Tax=Streptomyces tailanensis TaxID=2569858 RepID=UPI00122DCCD4|nr:isochorismatase family protein [Streptomyces tailanensis]
MPGIPPIEPYALPTADNLPANTAGWKLDPDRAVLLVHDMQSYFLQPLPRVVRDLLVRNAARVRDTCAGLGVPVAYTAQPGDMTQEERGLLRDFWGPGMRTVPEEQQLVQPLSPAPGDWMFTKWRYSAFFRSDLLQRMRDCGRDQLVICGVYAHIGVLMSAVDAFTNDIQPFLVADATADFSRDYHWMAMKYAAERCAVVTTAEEVLT